MSQYIVASILVIVGLIAIIIGGQVQDGGWIKSVVTDIASALLVGGLLSLLFKMFQERESIANLRRLFRIHDSVDELGLCEIHPEVQGYSFTASIEGSDSLRVVMNDGLRWVGNESPRLL